MKSILILFTSIALLSQGCAARISKEEMAANRFMGDFARQQYVENGLSVFGVGGSNPHGKIKAFSLDFITNRKLKVDEARIFYVNIAQDMLNQVNSDITLQPFLDHYPFTIDDLGLSLSFIDDFIHKFEPPYIVYVSVVKGNIYYSSYNSATGRLFKEAVKEPYAEALRIVQQESKCSIDSSMPFNVSCMQ